MQPYTVISCRGATSFDKVDKTKDELKGKSNKKKKKKKEKSQIYAMQNTYPNS